MMAHKYRLQYRLIERPEGISGEEAKADMEEKDLGACDAAVLLSIINNEDGSSSTMILSKDGKTGEQLDDYELFKAWSLFAHRLANSPELDEGRKGLCNDVFDVIRRVILAGKEAPPTTEPFEA